MIRTLLLAAVTTTAALLVVGCDRQPSPPSASGGATATTVGIQLNWKPEPQFGGFYAAQLSGAYTRHNLDVNVVAGGVGAPTVQMVGNGQIEFGIVSADELLIARSRGNNVVALFAVYQTCPQGLMVRASRGLKEIGDIFKQPGTVAIESGLPYAMLLKRRYGFDQVKIVPSPGGDLSIFLSDPNFAQQCFVTSEPIAARKAGVEPRTFLIADAGYNPYTTVLVTREEYLKSHPEVVKSVVAAVREGWGAYLKDSAATDALMHKLNPGMDPETFTAAAEAQKPLIETDETRAQGLGYMSNERWITLADQLFDLGVLKEKPAIDACFVSP